MISIAVDGYSGSGKGELCKGLAKKFNLKHLDTGAILRAVGLYFYKLGITDVSSETIEKYISKIDIKIKFDGDTQHTFLNGEDVSGQIRTEAIGQMASKVAIFPKAMNKVIVAGQAFSKEYDCIIDGRNITSEVLPNADVKFFLTASLETRAKRRLLDDQKKGLNTTLDQMIKNLEVRDFRDTHREFSAMVIVPDAVIVDNTNMTTQETINYCSKIINEKLKNN